MSAALPKPLQSELPTVAEFARDFPLISLVQLRIEIERELRSMLDGNDSPRTSPHFVELGAVAADRDGSGKHQALSRRSPEPPPRRVRVDVPEETAAEAAEVAGTFLAELRAIRAGAVSND